jgi:tetratricopeptide (TPR) repeat protein
VATDTNPAPAGAARPETERLEQIQAWVKASQRGLTITGAAVAIVAAGVWFFAAARSRREGFAERELNRARASAEAGNLPLAASDLSRIIDSYGGTGGADEANLLRGQVRLLQGQPPLAVSELREFLAKGPHAQYRAPAYGLLGAALEQARDYRAAGDAYEQGANAAQYPLLSGQMLLNAGRAYSVAGDTVAAQRVYERAAREHANSPISTEAQLRLGELGRFGAGG